MGGFRPLSKPVIHLFFWCLKKAVLFGYRFCFVHHLYFAAFLLRIDLFSEGWLNQIDYKNTSLESAFILLKSRPV